MYKQMKHAETLYSHTGIMKTQEYGRNCMKENFNN